MKGARRGFTLVEVLVALVIMGAALAMLSQGFAAGGLASYGAQNQTLAAIEAASKIAELEAGLLPLDIGQSGTLEAQPDGSWTWEIATEPLTAPAGLYHVTVTIRWVESGGERAYSLVRLMRERPAVSP